MPKNRGSNSPVRTPGLGNRQHLELREWKRKRAKRGL